MAYVDLSSTCKFWFILGKKVFDFIYSRLDLYSKSDDKFGAVSAWSGCILHFFDGPVIDTNFLFWDVPFVHDIHLVSSCSES
jgi:hypothetical protein